MEFPRRLPEYFFILDYFERKGVKILSPENTWISPPYFQKIGRGTVIYPNCYLIGDTNSSIGENCEIGPNAYLREWFKIGDNVKIGFNAEIVRSSVNDGTKIPHNCHVGDAIIGRNCNIAAGVIFCNFDGEHKNTTIVEDDVFVGSDVMLIPSSKRGLRLGQTCYIAANARVNRDVPPERLVKLENGEAVLHPNIKVIKENNKWKLVPFRW